MLRYLPKNCVQDASVDYTGLMQHALNNEALVTAAPFPVLVSDAGLDLQSNQELIIPHGSLFKSAVMDKGHYEIIRAHDKDNINVYGDLHLLGDRDSHIGSAGEWGHGVSVRGSSNIRFGEVVSDSMWGDSFYVGQTDKNKVCTNIEVEALYAHNSRRQGLSVISVRGLRIKELMIKRIHGTGPAAGIDFEPNNDSGVLQDIHLGNVLTQDCEGYGIMIYLKLLTEAYKERIDITIDNHIDIGSLSGFYKTADQFAEGIIHFKKANYARSQRNGVFFRDTDAEKLRVYYEHLHIDGPFQSGGTDNRYMSPILIQNFTAGMTAPGGLEIKKLTTSGLHPDAQLVKIRSADKVPVKNLRIGHDETDIVKIADVSSLVLMSDKSVSVAPNYAAAGSYDPLVSVFHPATYIPTGHRFAVKSEGATDYAIAYEDYRVETLKTLSTRFQKKIGDTYYMYPVTVRGDFLKYINVVVMPLTEDVPIKYVVTKTGTYSYSIVLETTMNISAMASFLFTVKIEGWRKL